MKKKIMTGLIALAFACSLLILMTSCAKKQVQVSEGVTPSAQVSEKVTAADEARMKEQMAANEAYRKKKEAERQALLREMQKRQELKVEMRHFQAEKIYFDFDKSELKPQARAVLKKKADWLRANPGFSLVIEGHCDERGTNEYNLALGERRAVAAWKFLNALGISGERMSTISFGEEKPADPRHTIGAWAKNRRDEFKLKKK